MKGSAHRLVLSALLTPLLVACNGGAPGSSPANGRAGVAPYDNDMLPPVSSAARLDPPFAGAARAKQSMTEMVTQEGVTPSTFGVIEVPEAWATTVAASDSQRCGGWEPCSPFNSPADRLCAASTSCALWQAVSPEGNARIAVGSPSRGADVRPATRDEGSAAAWIAHDMLRALAERGGKVDVVATSAPLPGRMPASRRGWSTGAAWLAIARDGPLGATHEFLAIEVEVNASGRGFHDVQTGPLLMIEVPSAQFDLASAEAVWRSMRVDAGWIPRWWLAWEVRTVRTSCEGGYQRGECTRQPGQNISYFQSGRSLGIWDLRVNSRYGEPEPERYDR